MSWRAAQGTPTQHSSTIQAVHGGTRAARSFIIFGRPAASTQHLRTPVGRKANVAEATHSNRAVLSRYVTPSPRTRRSDEGSTGDSKGAVGRHIGARSRRGPKPRGARGSARGCQSRGPGPQVQACSGSAGSGRARAGSGALAGLRSVRAQPRRASEACQAQLLIMMFAYC